MCSEINDLFAKFPKRVCVSVSSIKKIEEELWIYQPTGSIHFTVSLALKQNKFYSILLLCNLLENGNNFLSLSLSINRQFNSHSSITISSICPD